MNVPTDRKYTESHEWVMLEGDIATIGITQYAADELTDITFVELPKPGTRVYVDAPCGEIESVKATSELNSGVGGKVVEVNAALEEHPELINQDAHGSGWMIKVRVADASVFDELMDAAAYAEHIASG